MPHQLFTVDDNQQPILFYLASAFGVCAVLAIQPEANLIAYQIAALNVEMHERVRKGSLGSLGGNGVRVWRCHALCRCLWIVIRPYSTTAIATASP